MISREGAFERAKGFLDDQAKSWKHSKVRIIREDSFSYEGFLVVPYNSVDYLDGGVSSAILVGNLPVRVDLETGECHFLDLLAVLDCRDLGFPV